MDKLKKHWTASSTNDFVCRIASDYVAQIENKLQVETMTHSGLATALDVTPGRVSQVLNNPGNLTLRNTVLYAQALEMKVALVAYEDNDPDNEKGPVNSEIFHRCWRHMGSPRTFFELSQRVAPVRDFVWFDDASNDRTEDLHVQVNRNAVTRPVVN